MGIKIDILLATYNGAGYLDCQIESINKQTFKNWRIIARDDGSKDNTIKILKNWQKKLGPKLFLIEDNKNLGVRGNFERLINFSDADYIAFCDQDDIWHEEKLSIFINEIQRLERNDSKAKPCVVFSDLSVIDVDLNKLYYSFWRMQKIKPEIVFNYKHLALSNCVTGCAMMVNRAAINISIPMTAAVMHDWWISLCVSRANGYFGIIKDKTVFYRQHSNNVIGAKEVKISYLLKKMLNYKKYIHDLDDCFKQAKALNIYNSKCIFGIKKIFFLIEKYLAS